MLCNTRLDTANQYRSIQDWTIYNTMQHCTTQVQYVTVHNIIVFALQTTYKACDSFVGGHACVPIGGEGNDRDVGPGLKHTAGRGVLTESERDSNKGLEGSFL